MKKVLSWLLIFTLLFGCADLTGLAELLPKQSAYAEELPGGNYKVYFAPRRVSIESSFSDLTMDFYSGEEIVGSWKPHEGEAFWDEATTTMSFDKRPTRVVITCQYLIQSEYLTLRHAADFTEELNTHAVDLTHPAGFWFGSYSIVEDTIWYVDLDGNIQKPQNVDDASRVPWATGWNYLAQSLTINYRFSVYGNANVILADGATLAVNGGLELGPGASLTVWGQKNNTGCIRVSAGDYDAGIGGGEENSCGNLTVNGGTVIAYGGEYAAGVGGGQYGFGGNITVNGGRVEAHGGELGAGIGGGEDRSGGTLTVNGGTVEAYGGSYAAGIGGGDGGNQGGAVTISGGKVKAIGGAYGAGIGGGEYFLGGGGQGGYVNITGGEVYAEDGSCAAGIGGGFKGKNGDIVISGGKVEAHGSYGAAIGSGYDYAQGGSISILGGQVKAVNHRSGAGIGGGSSDDDGRDGGTINISNAFVLASSVDGAGIGGGGGPRGYDNGGNGGNITITDSIVTSVSLAKGAGIGGGNDGNGGNITINGGTVIASGGHLDYSYIAENEHVGASIHGSASGINGGINAGQGTMDSYCYDKIADFVLELVFSGEYGGAGIGGGDDGDGGKVTILNGAGVFANAGMNTAKAIGRGDGGDGDGSLTLYDTATVSAGSNKDSLTRVESSKRVSSCRSVFADITPCDHPDVTPVDLDPYQHRISCMYCSGTDRTLDEPHRFDKDTRLCACGHAQHAVNLGIYGGVMAQLVIDGVFYVDSPQYLSTGGSFMLVTGGNPTVSATYVMDGETLELEPDSITPPFNPQYGWTMYSYNQMPDADVDIKVVGPITGWKSLRDTLMYALDGSRITVPRDMTAGNEDEALVIPSGKTLTLDLNGHTLNRGLYINANRKDNGQVMTVHGDLTLIDSKGGGKLTGGFNDSPISAGGVDIRVGGTLRMYGGEISGNGTEKGFAGGVFVDEGAALHLGGNVSISGNSYRGAVSNVVLAEKDARIVIDRGLSDDSSVGVGSLFRPTKDDPLVFTQGLEDRGSITAFFSDDALYKVIDQDGEAALWSLPEFDRAELELGGILNMRFYMKYPDGWDPTGDRMEFTVNGLRVKTVAYDASASGDGKDFFACPVNAYQMADVIKAEYYYSNGKAAEYEYTVKQYLNALLSPAYRPYLSAQAINLAQATANYGHYIQPYLAETNGWTVGEDHAEMDLYNEIPYGGNPAGQYGFTFNKTQAYSQNVTRTEFYLTLDSDTLLNVRLFLKNGDDTVTGKVGDKNLKHWKRAGNSEVVCLQGIPANALGIPYTFQCFVNGVKVFDLSISALSYVNLALKNSGAAETEKMALTALYNYALAANSYAPPTA